MMTCNMSYMFSKLLSKAFAVSLILESAVFLSENSCFCLVYYDLVQKSLQHSDKFDLLIYTEDHEWSRSKCGSLDYFDHVSGRGDKKMSYFVGYTVTC